VPTYSPIYEIIKQKQKEADRMKLPSLSRINIEFHEEIISMTPQARKLKALLNSGANIDYQDTEGYTALMLAADSQNDRIAEYLLKQGANPLLKNKSGETAKCQTACKTDPL
jgi:ankyrin repeat protein